MGDNVWGIILGEKNKNWNNTVKISGEIVSIVLLIVIVRVVLDEENLNYSWNNQPIYHKNKQNFPKINQIVNEFEDVEV